MTTIGQRIKNRRIELGMSQAELSEASGINRQSLSRYENDTNEIKQDNIKALTHALGVSADWLLGLTDEHRPTYRYSFDDLDPDEIDLVKTLREAPTEERAMLIRLIKAFQHEFIHSKS